MTTPPLHESWCVDATAGAPLRREEKPLSERFRVEALLGQGGMGRVYRAYDQVLGRRVAVKILLGGEWTDARVQRFLREARLLAGLNHPGILPLHEFGVEESGPFLVTALVEGAQDLASYVAERSLAERLACMEALLSAVAYAHEQGVVHRDLKPDNVLVDSSGRTYLCDFGLAWAPGVEDLTQTNALMGTPLYAAPEQLLGEVSRSPRGDVFSLGVMLYELVAGRNPFGDAQTIPELCALHSRPSASRRDLTPFVPPRVAAACLRAMSPDPDQRFEDAGAFLAALRAKRSGPGLALALAAALSLSLAGIVLYGLNRGATPAQPSASPPASVSQTPPTAPPARGALDDLGQRSRATYTSESVLSLDGRRFRGLCWKLEVDQRVVEASPKELVLSGRLARVQVRMRYFNSTLAYDGWAPEGARSGATFFQVLEGAEVRIVIDREQSQITRFEGLNRILKERLIPGASAWRSSPEAMEQDTSLAVLGDGTIERGLQAAFSNHHVSTQIQPLVQTWLMGADAGRCATLPPLIWNPLTLRLQRADSGSGRSRFEGQALSLPGRVPRYALSGESRAEARRFSATLTERYSLADEPEGFSSLLLEHFGARDWTPESRTTFTRTLSVEIVAEDE